MNSTTSLFPKPSGATTSFYQKSQLDELAFLIEAIDSILIYFFKSLKYFIND